MGGQGGRIVGPRDVKVADGRTRLVLSVMAGESLLVGDAVLVFRAATSIVFYAPESTKIVRGNAIGESDPQRLQDIAAAQMTGPYRVDGVPGYVRDFADAAQAAELVHRDERPSLVRDKYDNIVYRSQGGPA